MGKHWGKNRQLDGCAAPGRAAQGTSNKADTLRGIRPLSSALQRSDSDWCQILVICVDGRKMVNENRENK